MSAGSAQARSEPSAAGVDWDTARFRWAKAIRADSSISRRARLVAVALALDFESAEEGYAWPSFALLGEAAGYSERSARYAVSELERAGWLMVEHRRGRSRSNVYRFRFAPASAPDGSEKVVPLERPAAAVKPATVAVLSETKTGKDASGKPASVCRRIIEGIKEPPPHEREGAREAARGGPPEGEPGPARLEGEPASPLRGGGSEHGGNGGRRRSPRRREAAEETPEGRAGPRAEISETFWRELLEALGVRDGGAGRPWWSGDGARDHVRRWRDVLGLSETRILEIAKDSRAAHPEPPDGPKALDRRMERVAAEQDRPAPPALTPERRQAAIRAHDDRLAEWINGPQPIPCSAVPSDVAARLLEAGKVTRQRMREKGLPW